VFGSATLIAFLVQVVTGIALSSAYVTGSGQAYDSLRFITSSPIGRIIRGIHYFGASAMIILIGLHTLCDRTLLGCRHPRAVVSAPGSAAVTRLSSWNGQRSSRGRRQGLL